MNKQTGSAKLRPCNIERHYTYFGAARLEHTKRSLKRSKVITRLGFISIIHSKKEPISEVTKKRKTLT